MQIEGTVDEVMESWPVQLTVRTSDARYHAELTADVSVATQARLVPGTRVRLVCDETSSPSAVIVRSVEILDG